MSLRELLIELSLMKANASVIDLNVCELVLCDVYVIDLKMKSDFCLS